MGQAESECLLISNHTIFTGGHFMMTPEGPHLNSGTLHSFQKAAEFYSKAKKKYKNVSLGILINDIGVVCSASGCSLKASSSRDEIELPIEYLQILSNLGIQKAHLEIFWEKHIRNRAKKLLHKELLKETKGITCSEDGYIYQGETDKIPTVLTRPTPNDKYGSPACPLIMSAYGFEQNRLGYSKSVNFYYVGNDNYLNIANHYVIEKGRMLANRFGSLIDVTNIYLFDDGNVGISDKL